VLHPQNIVFDSFFFSWFFSLSFGIKEFNKQLKEYNFYVDNKKKLTQNPSRKFEEKKALITYFTTSP